MAAIVESTSAGHQTFPQAATERLTSLDAYRGLIMIMLCSEGFGFRALHEHPTLGWIGRQFRHVPWEGMAFWDLVQPAFMFMVGVAMPLAFAHRIANGATQQQLFRHAVWRCLMLLTLSHILMAIQANQFRFQLLNVLAQIALTYFLCFCIMRLPWKVQAIAAALILSGHWALFVLFPGPDGPYSKDHNIGALIDRAVLGYNYEGRWVTINFISSTVTTLFGVWTGRFILENRTHRQRIKVIAGAAAACFAAGLLLEPFNPMIKRIWTASYTLLSAGWVFAGLLFFYWLVEVQGSRRVTFPLAVAGMNSIFLYSVYMVLRGWIDQSLAVFTGGFSFAGDLAPVAQGTAVVLVMWYLCYWLYQRRIFLKF